MANQYQQKLYSTDACQYLPPVYQNSNTPSNQNRSLQSIPSCNYMSPRNDPFSAVNLAPISQKNGNVYSPSIISFPQQHNKQMNPLSEGSAIFNRPQNEIANKIISRPSRQSKSQHPKYENDQENMNPSSKFNYKPTQNSPGFHILNQPSHCNQMNSCFTPSDLLTNIQKQGQMTPYLTPQNENVLTLPVRDPYTSSSKREIPTNYTHTTQRLDTISARDDLSELSTYSDKQAPQTFADVSVSSPKNVNDITNAQLLQQQIDKVKNNSQKTNYFPSAKMNYSKSYALIQRSPSNNSTHSPSKSVNNTNVKDRFQQDSQSIPQYLQQFQKNPTNQQFQPDSSFQTVSQKVKNCMTPHKRNNQSQINTPYRSNTPNQNNNYNNPFNERESREGGGGRNFTPQNLSISQQMEREITNADVRKFLKRNFLVGERLICDNWESIPLIYFVKLVVSEFPEVLEDHQIGENLLSELKETIGSLIFSDSYQEFICLAKLQEHTKATGLLGLVLNALKELGSENRLTTNPSILQNGRNNTPSHQSYASYSRQMEQIDNNTTTTLQQNDEVQWSMRFKLSDIQNIKKIISEFVETLYKQMESQLYSKFDTEMRRLTSKYAQTEQILRLVNDKISNNYYLFQQESSLQKKLKSIEEDNKQMKESLNQKDIEIQRLLLVFDSLNLENSRLEQESQKLHQRLEKYMSFGIQNLQTLYENNLQDRYKQLVDQQKAFFEQLEQDRQKVQISQPEKKQFAEPKRVQGEICNFGEELVTLQDEDQFENSNNMKKSKVREFQAKQKDSSFRKNITEGQMLEKMRESGENELEQTSNKMAFIKVLSTFIEHENTLNSSFKRIEVTDKDQNNMFTSNKQIFSTAIGQNSNESFERVSQKLTCLVEVSPLFRDVRLITQNQLYNFLFYFYHLQSSIYFNNDHSQVLTKEQKISSIPLNKCWKKILKELNEGQFILNTKDLSHSSTIDTSQTILTPIQKLYAIEISKRSNELSSKQAINSQQICSSTHNNEMTSIQRSQVIEGALIQNPTVINILLEIFRQHLERISDSISFQKQQQLISQQTNHSNINKLLLLKALLYLNSLLIATNKADIQKLLSHFLIDISPIISDSSVSQFIRENNIIGIIFMALKAINYANTKVVTDSLQFFISFKAPTSNYMPFVRQAAQDKNVNGLFSLLEQHSDQSNISSALEILKNLSPSLNFTDMIKKRMREVLDLMIQRYGLNSSIKELAESIKGNIPSSINTRTMNLPAQVQINFVHSEMIA